MGITNKYDLQKIEKACRLVVSLEIENTEPKPEVEINQTLSDLTGLELDIFVDAKNMPILPTMLGMIDDDNKKVLVARLLQFKNHDLYFDICERLLSRVDEDKLYPQIKRMI